MSVLVKGMDMPESCPDCVFYREGYSYNYCCASRATPQAYIPQDCPLVEVLTPHGRLADCDAVKECIDESADCDIKTYALFLLDWAVSKRTVIEAEE